MLMPHLNRRNKKKTCKHTMIHFILGMRMLKCLCFIWCVVLYFSLNIDILIPVIYEKHAKSIYITPEYILGNTAIVVKTFERPECLSALLQSISKFAPKLHIIVADDSFIKYKNIFNKTSITYIELPYDVGVGMGRNYLISEAHRLGYKYVIMSDDDYIIRSEHLIYSLAEKMIDTGADVVAPKRCENTYDCSRGMVNSFLKIGKYGISILPSTTYSTPINGCIQSEIIQQFFIGKTSVLLNAWDNKLKSNDHYDAMLTLKERGAKLFQCDGLIIYHNNRKCSKTRVYKQKRFNQWLELMPYVLQKRNITWMSDEVGRNWSISSRNTIQTQCGEKCLSFPKYKQANASIVVKALARLNSVRPLADQIYIKHNTTLSAQMLSLNPCQIKISFINQEVWWNYRALKSYTNLTTDLYIQQWCFSILQAASYKNSSSIPVAHDSIRLEHKRMNNDIIKYVEEKVNRKISYKNMHLYLMEINQEVIIVETLRPPLVHIVSIPIPFIS